MNHASRRQQPENEDAQVHQGDGRRPTSPPSLAELGERATVAPREADPKSISRLSRGGLRRLIAERAACALESAGSPQSRFSN